MKTKPKEQPKAEYKFQRRARKKKFAKSGFFLFGKFCLSDRPNTEAKGDERWK